MLCPKCQSIDLLKVKEKGVELDYCEQCGGIWFDRGELEKMTSMAVDLSFDQMRSEFTTDRCIDFMEANCPVCETPMEKVPKEKVANMTIDQCYKCRGIWLDGGEFAKISQALLLEKIRNFNL